MTPKIHPLSDAERALKLTCENAIHFKMNDFVHVGEALQTIRDKRLYREDYATFADYCQTMWAMSARRATQLRQAAQVVLELIGTNGTQTDVPENERQARALLPFDADLRPAILRIAKRTADALAQPLSASIIASVGEQLQLAATTGAVDTGDGESTVLTAAITQQVHEDTALKRQQLRDAQKRVTVQGQVFMVGSGVDDYIRIAVRLNQPGAEKLANLQTVTVVFTPYEESQDERQTRKQTHAARA